MMMMTTMMMILWCSLIFTVLLIHCDGWCRCWTRWRKRVNQSPTLTELSATRPKQIVWPLRSTVRRKLRSSHSSRPSPHRTSHHRGRPSSPLVTPPLRVGSSASSRPRRRQPTAARRSRIRRSVKAWQRWYRSWDWALRILLMTLKTSCPYARQNATFTRLSRKREALMWLVSRCPQIPHRRTLICQLTINIHHEIRPLHRLPIWETTVYLSSITIFHPIPDRRLRSPSLDWWCQPIRQSRTGCYRVAMRLIQCTVHLASIHSRLSINAKSLTHQWRL